MKTTFIYALCEPGTRTVRYIGKTVSPKKRFQEHFTRSVRVKTHLGCWLKSLKTLGKSPEMVVLREVGGDGSDAEKRFIRLARGCQMNLINATEGGDGGITLPPGWRHSPEARAKIGAKLKGKYAGDRAPWFGKKHTKEELEKMSAANTGEKNGMFGKHHTPEARAEMSLKRAGIPKGPMSEAHKAAVSASKIAANARRRELDQEIEWALAPYTLTD